MRLTIGAVAAALVLGAALVGCGEDEPAVCDSVDELQTSADTMTDVNVSSEGSLDELQSELEDVENALADVKTEAEAEFSSQIDALDTALTTLTSSIDAATADPSTAAMAEVSSAASAFLGALDTFTSDVQSTC